MKSKRIFQAFLLFLLLTWVVLSRRASAQEHGFVQFFEDKEFKGSAVTIKSGTDIPDMKKAVTDDGKSGFNDKAASAKYQVPPGWQAVLYDEANFQKRVYVLMGSGEVKDFSKADGKCSSFRWESTGQKPAAAATPTTAPTTAPSAATPSTTPPPAKTP
jgi:hypothetical protein